MPAELKSPVLDEYLGRVRSHLPLRRGGDIVRELESSIRDRVDDLAAREHRPPDDEIVRRALAEIGEPESVAGGFVRQRSLVGPAEFRSFLTSTTVVFAVHLALIGVATTLARPLQFGPAGVSPIGPHGLVSTASAVLHALCLDLGLMVLVFAATGAVRRRMTPAYRSHAVDASPRSAAGRIALALLVALVLGVFRDKVFVVVTSEATFPLFTEWFGALVPLVMAVLALSAASDALYLVLGETRLTLAIDALHGAAGIACMLFLLRGGPILALPALPEFGAFYAPVNDFLAQLGVLVLALLAMVFAVKTVRRLVRCAQV